MTREQVGLCKALGTHFGVKHATVIGQAKEYLAQYDGEEHPVIELSTEDWRLRLGATKHSLVVGKMLFLKLLRKSDLYADFRDQELNEQVAATLFYSGGALMCIYSADTYAGLGGIYVGASSTEGVVIEPFKHYLQYNHPRLEEEHYE